MNENAVSPEIRFDDQADATEARYGKLSDAQVPGSGAEFDPGEAERASAFMEDALNEQEATESGIDLEAAPEDFLSSIMYYPSRAKGDIDHEATPEGPVFIENVDPNQVDIPLLITRTNARRFPGRRPGESLDDTLDRLARERLVGWSEEPTLTYGSQRSGN